MRQPGKLKQRTSALRRWCREVLRSRADRFEASRAVARRMGARVAGDSVDFGFWIPARDDRIDWLEIFTPLEPVAVQPAKTLRLRRSLIELEREEEFVWASVGGAAIGGADSHGAFYWVRRGAASGPVLHDCLAASLPYGSFAPAEVYDLETVQAGLRGGSPSPARGAPPRLPIPRNILEIHVETATPSGTLAGLNGLFQGIARKLRSGVAPEALEKLFLGYDAVELLPLEPVAEPRREPFWRFVGETPNARGDCTVQLRRPTISNWGYDTLIAGFPAVNPALLSAGRPHELAELAATLRDFPTGPVRLIFDVVLGHAHLQAERLLDPLFFAGDGPYGKSLDYRHPTVRAILLEMLRRKLNWGADGVRVDASQDIRVKGPGTETAYDDAFLEQISETVVETAGRRHRPFMIFEDGRPWPRPDWKLTATCRDVLDRQPHALQWSPWTFASNVPLEPTFWISRRWRLEETTRHGSRWVTGCSNHDTLRRGAASPGAAADRGAFAEAYDNPAALMLVHGFLPGVPMDFLQAVARVPWTFFRDADGHLLKTVCREIEAADWLLDSSEYRRPEAFRRLKGLGLAEPVQLRRFARQLEAAARLADFSEPETSRILKTVIRSEIAHDRFCRAWMADFREHCRIESRLPRQTPEQVDFQLKLRHFRLSRPWLRENLRDGDTFEHLWERRGAVVYRGRRRSPDGREEILTILHLAGDRAPLGERELPPSNQVWRLMVRTPRTGEPEGGKCLLEAGQGLLWTAGEGEVRGDP